MGFSKFGIGAVTATAVMGLGLTTVFAGTGTLTVHPGDTLWKIAHARNIPLESLERANPSINPYNMLVGTVLQLPNEGNTYTVQQNDTLWTIAKQFNVSPSSLRAANPSLNPVNLLVGTQVVIPTKAAPFSKPVAHTSAKAAPVKVTAQNPAHSARVSTVNQQDLYWLEHVISAEANAEPLEAQIAVGDVILHRMQAGGYGHTVKDVVFQISNGHYQFTSVANGFIYHTPTALSDQAALDVLQNHQDVIPGAMVFYNPAKTPAGSWVWSQPTIRQIGNLVFAK
ncbi:LysM peptidoglycan-binding domain-containing protein [Alicyclobacillus dauci]|uniref:LysM peptidoglycan-binding domain-containing protein n=1 Tax=Alicyclobacillus dauci TaxID=1475485 RepID=A0ABY6YYD1_9BACL|nr:LysM peptidoglycan-binding domain-containing protein [Alicyclobacillus dauci]WAH35437.1 LysM peptidoglycan-binding domain-containing protein [Alicyclobacillus dauci]